MSWAVILLKFQSPPASVKELEGADLLLPLGTFAQVRAAVDDCLPGVQWNRFSNTGYYEGENFTIEFATQGESPLMSLQLAFRGKGDGWPTLVKLVCTQGWTALDCATSEFINPADPKSRAWKAFQKFREQDGCGCGGGN